jgi:hypothetical protein
MTELAFRGTTLSTMLPGKVSLIVLYGTSGASLAYHSCMVYSASIDGKVRCEQKSVESPKVGFKGFPLACGGVSVSLSHSDTVVQVTHSIWPGSRDTEQEQTGSHA